MFWWTVVLFISLIVLTRTLLIILGYFKEPVLQKFERYGEEEGYFFPLTELLLGAGMLIVSGGSLVSTLAGAASGVPLAFGIFILFLAIIAHENRKIAESYPRIFMSFPRWYYALIERTDRYERRQLAYMWLWLPWRLRLTYNSNTEAFFHWVDMVVMANTRREGADAAEDWPWTR